MHRAHSWVALLAALLTAVATVRAVVVDLEVLFADDVPLSIASLSRTPAIATAMTAAEQSNTLRVMQVFAAAFPDLGWTGTDYCAWTGVTCYNSRVSFVSDDVVAAGTLPDLPDDVDYASVLIEAISVYNAGPGLTGTLPASWGRLQHLRIMNVARTGVTGTLPAAWAALTALEGMTLANTSLHGTLPAAWAALTALSQLSLYSTGLTGTLPPEWRSMSGLQTLQLQANRLSGTLPPEWADMASIERVAVQSNNFCGCVPESWRNSTTMRVAVDAALTAADCASANACDRTSTTSTTTTTTTTTTAAPCTVTDCAACVPGRPDQCVECMTGMIVAMDGTCMLPGSCKVLHCTECFPTDSTKCKVCSSCYALTSAFTCVEKDPSAVAAPVSGIVGTVAAAASLLVIIAV